MGNSNKKFAYKVTSALSFGTWVFVGLQRIAEYSFVFFFFFLRESIVLVFFETVGAFALVMEKRNWVVMQWLVAEKNEVACETILITFVPVVFTSSLLFFGQLFL